MAVARVQHATNALFDTAATGHTAPALPAPATAGNLLIAAWGMDKNAGTVTGPPGWTVLANQVGASVSLLVAYKIAAGGDAAPTATWSTGTTDRASAVIAEYAGVSSASPIGPTHLPAYDDTNRTGLTLDPAAATAAGAALAFFAMDSITTSGSNTDFRPAATGFTWVDTAVHASDVSAPAMALSENLAITSGQDIAPAFTWTRSDQVAAFIVLLNQGAANVAPTVNAGPDQTGVEPWSTVTLTATASDPDGTTPTVTWAQTGGSAVTLSGSGASRTFTAPGTLAGDTLTFTATASDGSLSASDSMTVTVLPVTERAVIGGVEVPMQIRAT